MNSFRISPRITLESGSRFRLSGGPIYIGDDKREHQIRQRGTFEVREIISRGKRIWIEGVEIGVKGIRGATRMFFVQDRSYQKLGILWRPYKVRRVRK